jgi:hypothetical protein
MVEMISGIGNQLGFSVRTTMKELPKSTWQDKKGKHRFRFYISASAILGKFLAMDKLRSERNVIVLPGGRANLVMFKLNRDPRLKKFIEQNFTFLKYRHARQLANNPSLNLDNLESQLALDPITYSQTQLRMF